MMAETLNPNEHEHDGDSSAYDVGVVNGSPIEDVQCLRQASETLRNDKDARGYCRAVLGAFLV